MLLAAQGSMGTWEEGLPFCLRCESGRGLRRGRAERGESLRRAGIELSPATAQPASSTPVRRVQCHSGSLLAYLLLWK